ncbi:stage III sporulation protein AH [Desulfitobacterium chlororespirans]|uniref:Stage III sporulation protein AG n=1 Tax=Desulfitobacterium chlororespirans DSM 11544 TaxID=1121395 RepID=A0A1M7U6G6_9FIRM|nr:stage III sporulation protein AH [Desulfitobacterium chlororespirans]SHN78548.1 stage III sporulation protein AG [Desulfitobacterium chlororespirans DSM 11544]
MNLFKDIQPKILIPAVLVVAAVCMLLYGKGGGGEPVVPMNQAVENRDTVEVTRIGTLEKEMEKKLVQNLQQMSGVGSVQVSVTLSSSLRSDYATNGSVTKKTTKESDKGGGTRESTEVTENNQLVMPNGASQPVIVMEERPNVAGVLIIAEGASDPNVRENIHNAVRTLLDIPSDKINVQPMGGVL